MTGDDDLTTSGYGRGMLLLASANAAYIVTAYAVTTITARLLDPVDFGSFGVVMAWITVLTALLVKGLSTVTAREMASGDAGTAWHAGRRLGIQQSVLLALLGVAAAPLVARLLDAPELSEEFAIGALAALTFGTNAVLLAWPTGQRMYGRQAAAQVAYAIARVTLVVGGAVIAGLWGAIAGYVLAPLLSSGSLLMRHAPAAADPKLLVGRMWRGVIPVSLVSIAVSAYFVVDIFALSAALGGEHEQVGVYVAFGTVAHVPYFLLQAASVVAVPALAAAAAGAARAAAVRRTMTDTIVLLAGPTLLLAVAGDAFARIVFGGAYQAEGIVRPLVVATAAVTIIANLVAVDVAIGRLRTALLICLGGVALVAALAHRQVGLVGDDVAARNLAEAVLAACAITLVVQALHVRMRHGALLDLRRSASGIALAVAASIPPWIVQRDEPRVLAAVGCAAVWLVLLVRLGIVDVRRSAARVATGEDADAAG